jgi:hypothetical protein
MAIQKVASRPLTGGSTANYKYAVAAKPVAPKPAPKPVVKKPPLPGNPKWSQAPEYGWTGSGDPNVVTQATQQLGGEDAFGGISYSGPQWGDMGGSIAPYSGPSADFLESQSREDLGAMSSSMTSKIRQALVDLGLTDTSQLTPEAAKYMDEATKTAAQNNKFSLFGQIATSSAKATAQQRAKLAAQGMLGSGSLTKSMQDILDEAEQKRYGGVREFSGSVADLLANYAQRQRDWASKIAEARFMQQQFIAGGGGGGIDPVTGRGYDSPERGARPGEWADLPVRVGWNPLKNSDAEYDMSGATRQSDGTYVGPQGQRYDENGRVI